LSVPNFGPGVVNPPPPPPATHLPHFGQYQKVLNSEPNAGKAAGAQRQIRRPRVSVPHDAAGVGPAAPTAGGGGRPPGPHRQPGAPLVPRGRPVRRDGGPRVPGGVRQEHPHPRRGVRRLRKGTQQSMYIGRESGWLYWHLDLLCDGVS